jgi:hypothetical protein
MANANRGRKTETETAPGAKTDIKALYAISPWSCRRQPDGAVVVIEAYVEAAGDWQPIAVVKQTAFIDAERTAAFIAKAVNDYGSNRTLIAEMAAALTLCLKCSGLTWEAEHEAEILIARARDK